MSKTDKKEKKSSSFETMLLLGAFVLACYFFGLYAILGIPIWGGIKMMIDPATGEDLFLKLQSILPTSTVRSLAKGLVEIRGKVTPIHEFIAPLNSKECVAYHYSVSQLKKTSNGKEYYKLLKEQDERHDFYIEDATGKVLVKAEDLEFYWMREEQRKEGSLIFKQKVLYTNAEVLLIGHASVENGQTIITKDNQRQVLMLAPADLETLWDATSSVKRGLIVTGLLITIICAVILILDIKLVDNKLIINGKTQETTMTTTTNIKPDLLKNSVSGK